MSDLVTGTPSMVDDPERRGQFFLEWQVVDPRVVQGISEAQTALQEVGGDSFEVRQSCAADNLHITLNELNLDTVEEVERVQDILQNVAQGEFAALFAGQSQDLILCR